MEKMGWLPLGKDGEGTVHVVGQQEAGKQKPCGPTVSGMYPQGLRT